jgi:hypothetical protein
MKKIKILLTVVLSCITLISCTPDKLNDEEQPIVVIKPTADLFKPAIVNIKASNTTGKSTAVTKRLVKAITFEPTNLKPLYNTKYTAQEYRSLPTDNVYDVTEEALNLDTNKYDERTYAYSASGNLESITINNIAYPGYNGTIAYAPITFEYLESGARVQITKYQNAGSVLIYEYNTIGQIINAKEVGGNLKYTFEYDENNNISSKYFYSTNAFGVAKPQIRYNYIYYANNTYTKNWIDVASDGSENQTSSVTYTYNKDVSGVYNNEAIYKTLNDNEAGQPFLHIISNTANYTPKYFYDADGYLIKYDKVGQSKASDITIFIYE